MKIWEIRKRLEEGNFTKEQTDILTSLFDDYHQSYITGQYLDEVNYRIEKKLTADEIRRRLEKGNHFTREQVDALVSVFESIQKES